MFFALSKILWGLARPTTIFTVMMLLGLILSHWPRRDSTSLSYGAGRNAGQKLRRLGWGMVLSAMTVFLLSTFTTLPTIGLSVLEDRFPRAEIPDTLEGIILLGGAVAANDVAESRGTVVLNSSAERVTEVLALARRYPQAKVVLSGFSGLLNPTTQSEAALTRRFLIDNGIDDARLILEDQSRNTAQNAQFTVELIGERPADNWLLVTSAWHMPRSMGCFAQQGWIPRPYPTDYRSTVDQGFHFDWLSGSMGNINTLVHEVIGLAVYWLTERTAAFFPSPQNVQP